MRLRNTAESAVSRIVEVFWMTKTGLIWFFVCSIFVCRQVCREIVRQVLHKVLRRVLRRVICEVFCEVLR